MRKSKAVEAFPQSNETLNEQIARKAYELYEQRGGGHGYDVDDWLTAEKFLQEETSLVGSPPKTKSKIVAMRRRKADR